MIKAKRRLYEGPITTDKQQVANRTFILRNILVTVLNKSSTFGLSLISISPMASSSMAGSSQPLDFSIPERLYGRFAMIAFDLVILSYVLTGQIIPGVF